MLVTPEAKTIGVTHMAQASIASLRARFTETPRRSMAEDSQPPPTEPMSAIR
jgi:hypothetical protein